MTLSSCRCRHIPGVALNQQLQLWIQMFEDKCFGTLANVLVSHVTCSSTEQTSSMCLSCLLLLMALSHRHRSLQNHASMDQLKKCLRILFSHDIIRILFLRFFLLCSLTLFALYTVYTICRIRNYFVDTWI